MCTYNNHKGKITKLIQPSRNEKHVYEKVDTKTTISTSHNAKTR